MSESDRAGTVPDEVVRGIERLAQPETGRFLLGVLLGGASAACAVGLMWTSAYLISASALRPPILFLMMVIVSVRFFALGRAVFRYLERLASHDAAFRMLGVIRTTIFSALAPKAPAGLGRLRRGDLLSRFMADVDQLQDLPLRVRHPALAAGTVAAASVLGIGMISWRTALVLLGFLVLGGLCGTLVPWMVHRRGSGALAIQRAAVNDDLLDLAARSEVLAAFSATAPVLQGLRDDDHRLQRTADRLQYSASLTGALAVVLAGLAALACAWTGSLDLGRGFFDGPMLAVLILVPLSVFDVIGEAAQAPQNRMLVRESARRIAELTGPVPAGDEQIPEPQPSAPHESPSPQQAQFRGIRLRGAAVGWPGEEPVLRGLNLDIRPGERLLLTGRSGLGKSTLALTLAGLLPLHEGEYLLNGVPAESLSGERLRRSIGLCEQTPHLFDGTVRDNLLLAAPGTSDSALRERLRSVGLWSDLEPRGGLDLDVGENGELLSGGQVQRLSLGRALLAGFPVIILDEPTANVDPERAQALVEDLLRIADDGRRTVILISHDIVRDRVDTAIDLDAYATASL